MGQVFRKSGPKDEPTDSLSVPVGGYVLYGPSVKTSCTAVETQKKGLSSSTPIPYDVAYFLIECLTSYGHFSGIEGVSKLLGVDFINASKGRVGGLVAWNSDKNKLDSYASPYQRARLYYISTDL